VVVIRITIILIITTMIIIINIIVIIIIISSSSSSSSSSHILRTPVLECCGPYQGADNPIISSLPAWHGTAGRRWC
jgi:hypothetical protein